MELTINGTVTSSAADAQSIDDGLSQLTGHGDSFAILADSERGFIQTAGSPRDGFHLEYQAGSLHEHYRCTATSLDLEAVRQAFHSYLAGDDRWLNELPWKRMSLSDDQPVEVPALLSSIPSPVKHGAFDGGLVAVLAIAGLIAGALFLLLRG